MGLRVEDSTCSCCETRHVTVWLTVQPFKRLCAKCHEHYFERPPDDLLAPEVPS